MDELEKLAHIARTQAGLATRAQALSLGISADTLKWWLRRGDLVAVNRELYRFRGAPNSWLLQAHQLLLATGGVLSHHTAAWLHGLDRRTTPPQTLDVVTQARTRKRVAHRVHLSSLPIDPVVIRGLRVTSLPRTVIDLVEQPGAEVERVIGAARRCDRGFPFKFTAFVATLPANHCRRGVLLVAEQLAGHPSALDSVLEEDVARALEPLGLPRPRPGFSVYDEGSFVMKVDFAWPVVRVALHCDGRETHLTPEQFERDARQRSTLAGLGWTNIIVSKKALPAPWWKTALRRALYRPELSPPDPHPPWDQLVLFPPASPDSHG